MFLSIVTFMVGILCWSRQVTEVILSAQCLGCDCQEFTKVTCYVPYCFQCSFKWSGFQWVDTFFSYCFSMSTLSDGHLVVTLRPWICPTLSFFLTT